LSDFSISGELSEEERTLKANAHQFAKEVMRPISQQLDEMNAVDIVAPKSPYWVFMRQAYEIGYHKLAFPEIVGGAGLTPAQVQIVMEELAWGSIGLTISLNTTFEAVVAMTVPQPEEYIKEFTIPYTQCKDGTVSGCWGVTEPDHGCDTGAMFMPSLHDPKITPSCTARLKGDEWIINGQKAAWVSGGTTAKTILLSAGVDPTMGFAGNGMFIFSLDRPGVSKGPPLEKMGMRDMTECEIFFDDVHDPLLFAILQADVPCYHKYGWDQ
jgi:acyl-CoA dehydrogenase